MARKTLHFRNASAYRKYVAFEHMHGLATKKKNKPDVVIAGKPHKVKHGK